MNNKITKLMVGFLLIFPFRLPISILMILAFDSILGYINIPLPKEVICTNVITTKIVYNIAIGSWMVYLLEKFSRDLMGRRARGIEGDSIYWWTIVFSICLLAFTIIDAISIYNIFYK